MKKKRAFAALLAAALCLGLLAGCGVNVEKTMEQANEAAETGDYATAIEQYEKVLEAEPDNTIAQLQLAYLQEQLTRQQALAKLLENPTDLTAWREYVDAVDEGREAIYSALKALEDYHPTDVPSIQSLLSDYLPRTPGLIYREGESDRTSVSNGASFDHILRAAFLIPPSTMTHMTPDTLCYSINGVKYTETNFRFTDNNDLSSLDFLFKFSSMYFSTPGAYNMEIYTYSSEYGASSPPNTLTFTIPADCVGAVEFSVPGGAYPTLGSVDVTTNHNNSTIYFTTDGTDPVQWDEYGYPTVVGEVCRGTVPLNVGSTTISARCVNPGGIVGELAQATYEVQSNHTKVIYSSNDGLMPSTMSDDGRYIYLASRNGLFRYDYDGSNETQLYEEAVTSVLVLENGEYYVFPANYQAYHCINGVTETLTGSQRELLEIAGAHTTSIGYTYDYDAQRKSALYNDKYNVYSPKPSSTSTHGGYQIEVSAPDGSNRHTVAEFSYENSAFGSMRSVALMGDNLLYYTCYKERYSNEYIYHYYVLNLTTGKEHPCTELDMRVNNTNRDWSIIGVTSDAIYYQTAISGHYMMNGGPLDDADILLTGSGYYRMDFEW